MKVYSILLPAVLGLSGCDSIKKSVIQTDKKVDQLAVAMNDHAGSSGAIQKLTSGDFEAFASQRGKLVLVDFYSDKCEGCKQLEPILEKLAVEYGERVVVGKVDIDAQAALAKEEGAKELPDLRFYRDGALVDKIVGLPPEAELRARMERHSQQVIEVPDAPESQDAEAKPENIVGQAIRKANAEGAEEKNSKAVRKTESATKKTKDAKEETKPQEPVKPKEPAMQPMKKDWMPPGMQKKGG